MPEPAHVPGPADRAPRRRHSLGALPCPDETLVGYIFRLAKRRRTVTPYGLAARVAMAAKTDRVTLDVLERVAEVAEVPFEALLPLWRGAPGDPFAVVHGVRLPISALDRPNPFGRRVCPACLAEHERHRVWWDLAFVSACPRHLARLLDRCPDCGRPLAWQGEDMTRCGCRRGGYLAKARSPSVTAEEARATAVIQGLLGDARYAAEAAAARAAAPFRGMAPGHAVEFPVRLGFEAVAARPRARAFSFERLGEDGAPPHEALSRALAAVEDWPLGLHRVLDTMRRRRVLAVEASLWKCTNPVAQWANSLPNGEGREVVAALRDYRRAVRREAATWS